MTPEAIVYTSNTGYTRQYAQMLGEKTGLPIYALEEAACRLPGGSPILYLGWVRASRVKGFSRASKLFSVCAVGAVGLCPAGTQTDVVRQASSIPESVPLFTLQGGFCVPPFSEIWMRANFQGGGPRHRGRTVKTKKEQLPLRCGAKVAAPCWLSGHKTENLQD